MLTICRLQYKNSRGYFEISYVVVVIKYAHVRNVAGRRADVAVVGLKLVVSICGNVASPRDESMLLATLRVTPTQIYIAS